MIRLVHRRDGSSDGSVRKLEGYHGYKPAILIDRHLEGTWTHKKSREWLPEIPRESICTCLYGYGWSPVVDQILLEGCI